MPRQRSDISEVYSLLDQGKPEVAAALLHGIVETQEPDAEAQYLLGVSLYQSGDIGNAEQSFQEAVSINPEHANALYYLGELAAHRDENERAIEFYERALEADDHHQGARKKLMELGRKPAQCAVRSQSQRNSERRKDVKLATTPRPKFSTPLDASSIIMKKLHEDDSLDAQNTLALIERLALSRRPRILPHVLPTMVLGIIVCIILPFVLFAFILPANAVSRPATPKAAYGAKHITPQQQEPPPRKNNQSQSEITSVRSQAIQSATEGSLVIIFIIGALSLLVAAYKGIKAAVSRVTIDALRFKIRTGIFPHIENIEVYRIVDFQLKQTISSWLTGDGWLKLKIEHGGHGTKEVKFLGLAKWKELEVLCDELRELVMLVRTGPWGKGVIY